MSRLFWLMKSCRFCSVVVPCCTQTAAPLEIQHPGKPEARPHHESLAIVETWSGAKLPHWASRELVQVVLRDIMSTSPDCMAGPRSAATGGSELHGVGVAQYGGSDGAAEIYVEADGVAALVHETEAGQAVVAGAYHHAALLDGVQAAALHHRLPTRRLELVKLILDRVVVRLGDHVGMT